METLPKLDLKRKAVINNYLIKQPSILEEDEEDGEKPGFLERVPGMGIILLVITIVIYQGGNVVTKKMTTSPFLIIFLRDFFAVIMQTPVNIVVNEPPFKKGTASFISVLYSI